MSAEGLDDEVARWLAYADGDLLAARTLITNHDIDRRIICSLAQQAAEKSLKAALIAEGIEPPRTHNLDSLIDLLSPESPLRRSGGDLASLTFWAVESRYPTEYEDASEQDAAAALRLADEVRVAVGEATGH